jgi:hypothetical protein
VENPQFCEFHYHLSQKRIEEVLADDFNGNIVEMVTAIVEMGLERNLLSPYNLQSIVSKRLNARLPFMVVKSTGTANTAASGGGRFNSTQALKRFCREQYKEASQRNPTSVAKPPKNSASKAEFVTWATQNNIDISHFRTRAYRRREACVFLFLRPCAHSIFVLNAPSLQPARMEWVIVVQSMMTTTSYRMTSTFRREYHSHDQRLLPCNRLRPATLPLNQKPSLEASSQLSPS